MKSVALHNLGCKVNSYETEVMQQKLQESGYAIVPFDSVADVYIVNTCTVTNIADRKSRQMLHRAKQLNPGAVVVAVGCYVQTGRETLGQDGSVDLCVGNNRKKDIVEILEAYFADRQQNAQSEGGKAAEEGEAEESVSLEAVSDKTLCGTTVIDINHTDEYEEMQLKQTAEHTRAYIKIQDGCNQFCSYCAIPYARGRVRSRKAEDVLAEVRGMVAAGYKEIVLTGIHISSYGLDFEKKQYDGSSRLFGLIGQLQNIEGLERIRLGSLEPRIITEETARQLAAFPKLCPHFHLSLQSGCDATLRRMNRHYTTAEYAESVALLRKYFEQPAITTDVIVGFPGETEEEFAQTKTFLEKMDFFEMHIFKYSRRAGTRAAAMPEQIPEEKKMRRSEELLLLEKEQSARFRRKQLGKNAEVLLEEEKELDGKRYLLGHTPDYVRVAVSAEENPERLQPNSTVCAELQDFLTEEILLGKCGGYFAI